MTAKRKWTVNDGTIQRQRPYDWGRRRSSQRLLMFKKCCYSLWLWHCLLQWIEIQINELQIGIPSENCRQPCFSWLEMKRCIVVLVVTRAKTSLEKKCFETNSLTSGFYFIIIIIIVIQPVIGIEQSGYLILILRIQISYVWLIISVSTKSDHLDSSLAYPSIPLINILRQNWFYLC